VLSKFRLVSINGKQSFYSEEHLATFLTKMENWKEKELKKYDSKANPNPRPNPNLPYSDDGKTPVPRAPDLTPPLECRRNSRPRRTPSSVPYRPSEMTKAPTSNLDRNDRI
jgi:hypothetical protein